MKNFFTTNIGLKALSFIFALISWYYVIIAVNPEVIRIYSIKLDVYDRSDEYEYTNIPEKVNVEVRGRRLDLIRLFKEKPFPVQTFINLKKTSNSKKIFVKTKKLVSFTDFEISKTFPSFVNVTSNRLSEKTFSVKYTILGSPASGYKVGKPRIEPEKITVLALEKKLNKLLSVMAKIDITGASQDISNEVKVNFLDINGESISGIKVRGNEYVNINIPIRKWPEKSINVKASIIGSEPSGYQFISATSQPGEILGRGPVEKLDNISSLLLDPIDITGITNERKFQVACGVDPDLKIIGTNIVNVTVKILPKVIKKIFKDIKVSLINVSGDKNFVISPDTIDIIVEGPESKVMKIVKNETIRAQIDVRKVFPGTDVIPVIIFSEKTADFNVVDVPKVKIRVDQK
jgi:YbbR domain-containing protein